MRIDNTEDYAVYKSTRYYSGSPQLAEPSARCSFRLSCVRYKALSFRESYNVMIFEVLRLVDVASTSSTNSPTIRAGRPPAP